MDRFEDIGIIKNEVSFDETKLNRFDEEITKLKNQGRWNRSDLIDLFNWMIPNFNHRA